ncbi:hypothetical protein Tco_0667873 [Tanacetum coccineum]
MATPRNDLDLATCLFLVGWSEAQSHKPIRERLPRLRDSAHLGALLDYSEALGSSKAQGSVLDRLRSVLAVPLRFFLDVLDFFQCHISLLNPSGAVRLSSFAVTCRAYGDEPTLRLF